MYCKECMKEGKYVVGQAHHIVSRRIHYMAHIPVNIAYLCIKHHTSSPKGIHHNSEMMLRYKQELELKLRLLFSKDYYTYTEIKELLQASENSTKAITKTLPRHKEGYKNSDLIMHLMGDRSYL